MLDTCPLCDAPLSGKREVVFDDVVLNSRGELFSAREVGENWSVACTQGHEVDVVHATTETDGSSLSVRTRGKARTQRSR